MNTQSDEQPAAPMEFLTKHEVADLFQVNSRTIERWMGQGVIPYIRLRRTVRFPTLAIRKLQPEIKMRN